MRVMQSASLQLFVLVGLFVGGCSTTVPVHNSPVYPNAHSHNDYRHQKPLLDALKLGFCSIEADVHLVDGQLLVGHDRSELKPKMSLEALYLDPLRKRVQENSGRVYRDGPSVTLLIDVKSEAEPTYETLRATLARYSDILTEFTPTQIRSNAVTVLISGNRALAMMAAEEIRYAAYDGRLDDLNSFKSGTLIPLISDTWKNVSQWDGLGEMPEQDRRRLRRLVQKAHEQNRRIRFWGTADLPQFWDELISAEVDYVGTDDPQGLAKYLALRKGDLTTRH